MPNKDYLEELKLKDFSPLNYKDLDEKSQNELSWKFEYMLMIDEERKIIMKNFWPENWVRMNKNQKLNVCQKLENNLSLESGRYSYKIIELNEDTIESASSNKSTRTIGINLVKNGDNPYFVLDNIVHESCHADQFELLKLNKYAEKDKSIKYKYKKKLEESGLSERDLNIMKWEDVYYINYHPIKLYRMQFMEVEANFESIKFLRKYSEYMKNDETYMDHVEKREAQLKKTLKYFNNEKSVQEWMEDRSKRVIYTSHNLFNKKEKEELKILFSSKNFNNFGSKLLENLETWNNKQASEIVRVSLDELTNKSKAKSKNTIFSTIEDRQKCEKQLIFGMTSTRL